MVYSIEMVARLVALTALIESCFDLSIRADPFARPFEGVTNLPVCPLEVSLREVRLQWCDMNIRLQREGRLEFASIDPINYCLN
jgi:hypothetical protein